MGDQATGGTPDDAVRRYEQIGAHEVLLEVAPEGVFVHWRVNGSVEVDDLKPVLDKLAQAAAPRLFLIVHIIGPGGFAPAARRYYVDWRRTHPGDKRWVFIIGASLVVRTLTTLLVRGTKLLTGHEPSIQLVQNEAEARRLIAGIVAKTD